MRPWAPTHSMFAFPWSANRTHHIPSCFPWAHQNHHVENHGFEKVTLVSGRSRLWNLIPSAHRRHLLTRNCSACWIFGMKRRVHELQSMIATYSTKLLEDARALVEVVVAPKLKTTAAPPQARDVPVPIPAGSASASEPAPGSAGSGDGGTHCRCSRELCDAVGRYASLYILPGRNVSVVTCGKAWQIQFPAKREPPRSRTAIWSAVRSHRACLMDCLSWAWEPIQS